MPTFFCSNYATGIFLSGVNGESIMKKVTVISAVILFFVALSLTFVLNTYQLNNPTNAQAQTSPNRAVTIHRYESPKMDPVNLYWIETNNGIVLVDTGRFLSQARYALAEIRKSTNKPILSILITHPHTDHYGGLPVFVKAAGKDVPIYASQITYDDIRTDGQGFIAARKELHGNDFPAREEIPLPNRIVKNGEKIQVGGLTFEVIDLPKNETIVTTLYYLPQQQALFSGDIIKNKSIPFLGDGFSGNWISQLQMLQKRFSDVIIYAGHGAPDTAKNLIPEEIEYITTVRKLVKNALTSDGEVSPQEKADIVAQMEKRYPDYETSLVLPGLLEAGIDGIAKELS